MKKKKLLIISVILTVLLLITGCTSKEAITTDQFISTAKEYNLEINDMTDNVSSENGEMNQKIKDAIYATSKDGWTIEFYVLEDKKEAESIYSSTQKQYEAFEENMTSRTTVNIGNYNEYTLITNESYMYVCRVDNTLLKVSAEEKHKDKIIEIIDKLGY